MATSFDISLQALGRIFCLSLSCLGSYRTILEESLPKVIIPLSDPENINFANDFFSSIFLSFLFLSFVIFGRSVSTLLRIGGGLTSISRTCFTSGIIRSGGIYLIGTTKSGSPSEILLQRKAVKSANLIPRSLLVSSLIFLNKLIRLIAK